MTSRFCPTPGQVAVPQLRRILPARVPSRHAVRTVLRLGAPRPVCDLVVCGRWRCMVGCPTVCGESVSDEAARLCTAYSTACGSRILGARIRLRRWDCEVRLSPA